MPDIIRKFRERYPRVTLVLEEAGTNELIAGLRSEEFDAKFIRSPVSDPQGLAVYELLEEQMLAALPNDPPLALKNI